MSSYSECPACSHKRRAATKHHSVFVCANCDAIYGDCCLGDSYEFVLPYFRKPGPVGEIHEERYFDFTCFGSKGLTRRHGWFDPATKLITQVG